MQANIRMKLCHVITGLNTGGAETALCRLLETLCLPDFDHVVIALGGVGTLSARVAAVAKIHHLGMDAAKPLPRDLWRLRCILERSSPSVVHAWMYHANLVTTLAATGRRVPLLWGIRQSLDDIVVEKGTTKAVIRMNALLSWRPRLILYNSVTSAAQHEAFGFRRNRTRVIPNGYDTAAFAPNPESRARIRSELNVPVDALAVGMVARVHPVKDHENFLRAAAHLVRDCPNAIFILAGDGADESNRELVSLIDELKLRERIRLCGRRTDVAALNAAFDIGTLSSRGEAFPNVIAEAMACGVPCVATDVGDVARIIGGTGVVVPPRNPQALSAGWMQLAALDALGRQALGTRARQRIIERYSLASINRQYADLYSSLERKC